MLEITDNCYPVSGGENAESTHVTADEDIVSKLASMGFNYFHCQKAAIKTSNAGVEEAMTWLLSHMDDPGWSLSIKKFFYKLANVCLVFRRKLSASK